MGKILYIADTHFGHSNIIKHCNRPFKNGEEMDSVLIEKWNETVEEDDTVYILGDFGYAKNSGDIYYLIEILKKLKGTKHLITGNHDRFALRNKEFMKEFSTIKTYSEIKDGDVNVVLFHYPIAEWNGYFRGTVHLYGHVHNNDNGTVPKNPNMYNVGVDELGWAPRTMKQIRNKKW